MNRWLAGWLVTYSLAMYKGGEGGGGWIDINRDVRGCLCICTFVYILGVE